MSITLTEQAISKIKTMFSEDPNLSGKALRVFVEKGGCNSYQYGFKFDDPIETDTKADYDNFKLLVDPETGKLLEGAIIDYKEDFGQEGFSIKNPNAKKSCGCGNSFDV